MVSLRWRHIAIVATVLVVFFLYSFVSFDQGTSGYAGFKPLRSQSSKAKPTSLFMTHKQCTAAFPDLARQVDIAAARGPFPLRRADEAPGLVQARIKDGKIYILTSIEDTVLRRVGAALHSLHRAVLTSPSPLPDTAFALNVDDQPRRNSWSFARSDDQWTPQNVWVMPHFSGWSWPLEYVGNLEEAVSSIGALEANTTWEQKDKRVVWRGSPWYNPEWSGGLRHTLLSLTEDKPWADVQPTGAAGFENNTLDITDFCRYKYILYVEGKSYSGRLPFHQACASVILTPPPTFQLHTMHLMRPLFSSVMLRLDDHVPSGPIVPPPDSYPVLGSTNTTWPYSYHPAQATVIFIKPDWSDLQQTVEYLEDHPDIARGIAVRQRELMVGKGYLSEAAEVCYWRSLISNWSKMAQWDEQEWRGGMRWETFSLLGKTTFA